MSRFFPDRIQALPEFEGPFDARRLSAAGCEVLFASYPAGTEMQEHAARFEVDTSEIEFWFEPDAG